MPKKVVVAEDFFKQKKVTVTIFACLADMDAWKFKTGEDFKASSKVANVRTRCRQWARDRGLGMRIKSESDGFTAQAYILSEEEKESRRKKSEFMLRKIAANKLNAPAGAS